MVSVSPPHPQCPPPPPPSALYYYDFPWKWEAEQGCRIARLPRWRSLVCQLSAISTFSRTGTEAAQGTRGEATKASPLVFALSSGSRDPTGNMIKNWKWRLEDCGEQKKESYQNWNLCAIQLYEHNGNNVGLGLNRVCSNLPSLLLSNLPLGTLFHLSESQSPHPNVY